MEEDFEILLGLFIIFILFFIFIIPTFIAFIRNHHYKWIILALNIFGSLFFGMGWFVSLIWALWPSNTAIADPIINDPTSNSKKSNQEIYQRYGENLATFNESYEVKEINEAPKKYCHNCGLPQFSDNSIFCKNCGEKLKNE